MLFAKLNLSLLSQHESYELINTPARDNHFDNRTMEDVLQEHQTISTETGVRNPLDGRPLRALIVPGIIKRGTSRDDTKDWDHTVVLIKARVLV